MYTNLWIFFFQIHIYTHIVGNGYNNNINQQLQWNQFSKHVASVRGAGKVKWGVRAKLVGMKCRVRAIKIVDQRINLICVP